MVSPLLLYTWGVFVGRLTNAPISKGGAILIFRFYKNNSDNRKVSKNLTPIKTGSHIERVNDSEICPRVTSANANISQSSGEGWSAFCANTITNWNTPTAGECWQPNSDDETPFLIYHLNNDYFFNTVNIKCGSYYGGEFQGTINIYGSNDGLTYDLLIENQNIKGEYRTITINEYTVNSFITYTYIKIVFNQPLYVPYQPSLLVESVNVSGAHNEIIDTYDVNVIYKNDVNKDTTTLELAFNENLYNNANYCYNTETGYFYFLREPILGTVRLYYDCDVDLLMTYKDDILNLGCILSRQENIFNTYIKDNQQAILSKRVVDTRIAPHGFNTNDQFILATCGK